MIQSTLSLAGDPTDENIRKYNMLRDRVPGKGDRSKLIKSLMLSVLGLAILVGGIICLAAGVGVPLITAGVCMLVAGSGSMAAGIGFFNAGRDKGLYKDMSKIQMLPQDIDTNDIKPL